MKRILLSLPILLFGLSVHSQKDIQEQYVIYYFGATDCGYCNEAENIVNIKKIKSEFSQKYPEAQTKYVMVCFDNDIEQGLKFIQKYGYWDEISIGQRYLNDTSLGVLNETEVPGLPHIVVYKNEYAKHPQFSVPTIKRKVALVDLVGGSQINAWIGGGYPLSP